MLEKIKNLLTWKEQKSKSKIKKDKSITNLTKVVISDYIKDKWHYPLELNILIKYKNNNNEILKPFYNDFKDEFEIFIIEYFVDQFKEEIEKYLKDNRKYPISINDLDNSISNTLKELKVNDKVFKLIIKDFIVSEILKASKSNKMRTLFKEAYIKNNELFEKFIFINLDNDNKYKDFEKIGWEVKKILEEVEDQVLKHMEGWIHWDKSSSVSEKFKTFINTIFPSYYNIWVKSRKLSPEEMKEYIAKMSKK